MSLRSGWSPAVRYTPGAMAAENYDPNQELNPNLIMWGAIILVLAAFATVAGIVLGSEAKNASPPVEGAAQ